MYFCAYNARYSQISQGSSDQTTGECNVLPTLTKQKSGNAREITYAARNVCFIRQKRI